MTPGPFLTRALRTLALCLLASLALPASAQLSGPEQEIASFLSSASGQGRPFVHVDPILSRVARARAMDMAARHYFSHTNPDGLGANTLVRQAGYTLPASYDTSPAGNNIESIAAGEDSASATWSDWMGSPPHRTHLLAQLSFYAEQTSLGVGYYADPNSDYQFYWVVITAPPPGPALAITTPAANAGLLISSTTVSGTTGGVPAAASVVWRLENAQGIGAFQNASGAAQWSASVSGLIPGPNTLRVRSLNAAGGTLLETTRTFRYVVLSPLAVALDGSGMVTAGFIGTTQRELGEPIGITATPAVGWLFDHWSGSATATTPHLAFTMAEAFALTAHFRVNPFYALKGSYNGLIGAASPAAASSGWLKVATTVAGSYSGRLTLAGLSYSVAGIFDANGDAQLTLHPPKAAPLTLVLHLSLGSSPGQITGTVGDGTFTSSISADQALLAPAKHFAAGRYTVVLAADPSAVAAAIPQGDGYGLLTVSTTGAAALTGALADGHAFSQGATVSQSGNYPIFVFLPSASTTLAGVATFNQSTGTLAGPLLWNKAARPLDRYFPGGFATTLAVAGARYAAPLAGSPALTVAAAPDNSVLDLAAGDLQSSVAQVLTLSPLNRISTGLPLLPHLTVSLTASSGRYTGSFTHPLTKAVTHLNGVILQTENAGHGFFLGQSQSGAASLVAMPQ